MDFEPTRIRQTCEQSRCLSGPAMKPIPRPAASFPFASTTARISMTPASLSIIPSRSRSKALRNHPLLPQLIQRLQLLVTARRAPQGEDLINRKAHNGDDPNRVVHAPILAGRTHWVKRNDNARNLLFSRRSPRWGTSPRTARQPCQPPRVARGGRMEA